MSVTVNVVDHPAVRVSDEDVEAVPPDAVEFAVEGALTVSGGLLGEFAGRSLRPVAVTVAVDGTPVTVDLRDEAALRLESVDVGVETPDADDVVPGADALESPTEGVPGTTDAGSVAFTVEGTIAGIGPETFESLSESSLRVESITFAVDEARATDGGEGDDVVFEVNLLGFHVAVWRDGTIVVQRR